jgi:hypothetical protein
LVIVTTKEEMSNSQPGRFAAVRAGLFYSRF